MLKLYSAWRSSASYRVRIALALKALDYEYVAISLVKDEQDKPEYRALNPQGRIPLLIDGEFRVAQSLAILDYLEALRPQPALVPKDAKLRARMLAFCHVIVDDIHPLQNSGVQKYLGQQYGADDAAKRSWARHWIESGLATLEQVWAGDAHYVFGDQPTWADCVLVPQVYNADRYGCDASRFPRLYALAQRLRELPAFARAHPDRQPDAVK